MLNISTSPAAYTLAGNGGADCQCAGGVASPGGQDGVQTAEGLAGSRDIQASTDSQDGKAEVAAGKSRTPGKTGNSAKLSEQEQAELRRLQARDQEVRQHELAHLSAAGGLALGGPSFSYQRGPDGVNYAIGGEVQIDTSAGATPQETLAKASQIEAAALAPASPSGQDRAVAAQARQMAIKAQSQLAAAGNAAANPPGGSDAPGPADAITAAAAPPSGQAGQGDSALQVGGAQHGAGGSQAASHAQQRLLQHYQRALEPGRPTLINTSV